MDLAAQRRRYGEFPVEGRDWSVGAREYDRFAAKGPEPFGAAALIWNPAREVLLVREVPRAERTGAWATPGGMGEPGEAPEACAVREAREEAGVEVRLTGLTKVIVCDVRNTGRALPFTFFQFEGAWVAGTPRAGRGIADVRWFDRLPEDMHFREDYVAAWRGRRTD